MTVVVDLKDMVDYVGTLSDDMIEAGRIGMLKAAERGVQTIVCQLIPSRSPQPVDRAIFKAGWKTERIDDNTVAIFNPEPHAPNIEFGVRAENIKVGRAMLKALTEWALRKGIVGNKDVVKNAKGGVAGTPPVVWAIVNAMKKRGIFNRNGKQGLRIMDELVEKHINLYLREAIALEIKRAVQRR
jgi:hypothetical protein